MGNISYRSLTPIKEVIEETGFNISYPYDDLIFIESNAFLIQYDDTEENAMFLYFNKELNDATSKDLEKKLMQSGKKKKISIVTQGKFSLAQKENSEEELELKFFK